MSLLDALVLPAGREMDVTIGYHVMDLHVPPEMYPNYSTDISDAWAVAKKVEIEMLNRVHGQWEAYAKNMRGVAKSVPLAICRVALLIANARKEAE